MAVSHHARATQDVEAVPHDKYSFHRYYYQVGVSARTAEKYESNVRDEESRDSKEIQLLS